MDYKTPYQIEKSKKVNAPWIVLINGLFAGMDSWNYYAKNLSRDFNVLKYDSPGQGEAEPLNAIFTLDQQVQYLKDLIEMLKIEKVILLGISNGGRVALKFSEKYSKNVISVLAADTYSKLSYDLEFKIKSWLLANETGGSELRFMVSAPWIFGSTLINEKPKLINTYQSIANNSCPRNAGYLIQSALEPTQIDLKKISSPIHLLVGVEDQLTTIAIHREMESKIEKCDLTLIKGGHASLLECDENLSLFVMPILHNYLPQKQSKLNRAQIL